jgi:hypothetical protein
LVGPRPLSVMDITGSMDPSLGSCWSTRCIWFVLAAWARAQTPEQWCGSSSDLVHGGRPRPQRHLRAGCVGAWYAGPGSTTCVGFGILGAYCPGSQHDVSAGRLAWMGRAASASCTSAAG